MSNVLVYVSPIVVALSTVMGRWLKYRLIWRAFTADPACAVALASALRMTPTGLLKARDENPTVEPTARPENKLRAVDDPQLERPG